MNRDEEWDIFGMSERAGFPREVVMERLAVMFLRDELQRQGYSFWDAHAIADKVVRKEASSEPR